LLGEGPGRYLVELLRVNSTARVTCVEQSPRKIRAAQQYLHEKRLSPERVEFLCTDWVDWHQAAGGYDLIATHFFLDCFTPAQLEKLVPKVAAAMQASGAWIISDFCEPPHGWRRTRARV